MRNDLVAWLLSESIPSPVVHGDGIVSHYEHFGRGWVSRADRLTVLSYDPTLLCAFESLTPSAIRSLLQQLACCGWLWVREPRDGFEGRDLYLAHPGSPDAQRAKMYTAASEFMKDLGHAAVSLTVMMPTLLQWAANPPLRLADGTIRYWSWTGLTMIQQALIVPLVELCELAPMARDRLLKQMRKDGWTRSPMGNVMVHPSATGRADVAVVSSAAPVTLN